MLFHVVCEEQNGLVSQKKLNLIIHREMKLFSSHVIIQFIEFNYVIIQWYLTFNFLMDEKCHFGALLTMHICKMIGGICTGA